MALLSYAHGPSTIPLRGETIGDNLDRIAAALERAGVHDAHLALE